MDDKELLARKKDSLAFSDSSTINSSPDSPHQNSAEDSDIEEMPYVPMSTQHSIRDDSDIEQGHSSPEPQQQDEDITEMPSSTHSPQGNIQQDSDIEIVDP
jgi:hypothetical protein